MKIMYVCSFSLSKKTGKSRATYQKLNALKSLVDQVRILSLPKTHGVLKLLFLPFLELKSLFYILYDKPDVLISRGFIGYLLQPLARKLGIVTVREVHGDSIGEVDLLHFFGIKKKVVRVLSLIGNKVDASANIRIFNHPDLMEWYHKSYGFHPFDGFAYNGYDPESYSTLNKQEALLTYELSEKKRYLVFTGAANEWHGIEYLVSLQKEFDTHEDNIVIVCGGGSIPKEIDTEEVLKNITPLNDVKCADLIKAADACLLPVKKNRVSPGSPLKLYDYIVNDAWVIAQENTKGYSDEVDKYGIGIVTDFTNPKKARNDILNFLSNLNTSFDYPYVDISWNIRMREWVTILEKFKRKTRGN